MSGRCPQLQHSALHGDGVPPLDHARECAECASERASVLELSSLVQALDPPELDGDRADLLRARLLASAKPRAARARPRWMWGAMATAGVALAAAAIAVSFRPGAIEAPVPHGTVQPGPGARFVHPAVRPGEPEIVRVFDGTVSVEVTPLSPGERFLVVTEDAEIEVRGTRFDVVVDADKLSEVWVREGVVEVRPRDGAPRILRLGEAWHAPRAVARPVPEAAAPEAVAPEAVAPEAVAPEAAAPAPDRKREIAAPSEAPKPKTSQLRPRPKKTAPADVAPHERAFRDAWAAFARGDMGQAAELFARAEAAVPGASLAEDACYGRAVSLERAGRRAEAISEMRRFLAQYPAAVRGDEVAVSLGALLAQAGARDEARALFERALQSESVEIENSARRSLDQLR